MNATTMTYNMAQSLKALVKTSTLKSDVEFSKIIASFDALFIMMERLNNNPQLAECWQVKRNEIRGMWASARRNYNPRHDFSSYTKISILTSIEKLITIFSN